MYKDKDKQKKAVREAVQRYRSKAKQKIENNGVTHPELYFIEVSFYTKEEREDIIKVFDELKLKYTITKREKQK